MTKKITVAVLFGGPSTEHQISLLSVKNVVPALNRQRYQLLLIGIDRQGQWWLCDEANYLQHADDPAKIELHLGDPLALLPGNPQGALLNRQTGQPLPTIDVVFPLLHGTYGEDGALQGLLRWLKLPFVGCNTLASALAMDKAVSKRLLQAAGIPVTPFVVLQAHEINSPEALQTVAPLGLPLFVKPANQGSSMGVSRVTQLEQLVPALQQALRFDQKVLVEKAVIGQEIECAVLGNRQAAEVSLCGEIITHDTFYAYDTKYLKGNQAELCIPAKITTAVSEQIQAYALKAWQTLECEGLARVDFFVSNHQQIFLNEINTIPGFTTISMYPKLWQAGGITYSKLLDQLIILAVSGYSRRS